MAKVSIVKCKSYEPNEVLAQVKQTFRLLGGIDLFIKKGERVLIKPNILSLRPPEDNVCTHIEVIRAVIRLVKDIGAVPLVGDNPGGSISFSKAYEASGLLALSKEEGFELCEVKSVKMHNGIPIANYVFECDKIISLPKMKSHMLMGLTGAIKNMYGVVPGLYKTQCHKLFPTQEEFAKVLVDVFELVKPNIVLMDGVIGMDKEGPSSGRLRHIGLLIASPDSVALDAVFSSLVGIKPFRILTTKEAYKRGLGEGNLDNIEILGENLKDNIIKDFKLPALKGIINILGPFAKSLARFVKFELYIDKGLCKKCKVCAESCPVSSIIIDAAGLTIDSKKCLRCMCCHEVCPYGAVGLKRNVLAKIFGV